MWDLGGSLICLLHLSATGGIRGASIAVFRSPASRAVSVASAEPMMEPTLGRHWRSTKKSLTHRRNFAFPDYWPHIYLRTNVFYEF